MNRHLRIVTAIASSALLGVLISGCGGAGGTIPTTTALPASGNGTPVDQGDAASVAQLVTDAHAYAMPLEGHPPLTQLHPVVEPGAVAPDATRHPMDLRNYGGPTVPSTLYYDIYVNQPGSYWGTPSTFQTNLANSTMIHLIDQYVGQTGNARYTFGGSTQISYNTSGTLHDADIFNIVHSVALSHGRGTTAMYHVFFAQGVNQCSASAGGCYSPSNTATWTYCAYHGDATYSDIGKVLYSVEPYQAVSGCDVGSGGPNGNLIDSTASTLSHETFEAITDPFVADNNVAWYNNRYGEIGDECASSRGTVSLNGHSYLIQKEYSNYSHACAFAK